MAILAGLLLAVLPQADGPLTIDGTPAEAVWAQAQVQLLRPNGGEARILVRGRYVCVSATLPEADRVVALNIGRNPEFWAEDLVVWRFGVYTGGRNRTVTLSVNPFGGFRVDGVPVNRAMAAARIGDKAWTVEAALPLEELSSIGFVGVERVRAPRPQSPELRWYWPEPNVPSEYQLPSASSAPAPEFRPGLVGNTDPPLALGSFELRRDEMNPRPSAYPTTVRLAYDGATLSVQARAEGAEQVDEFQVYLSPTGSTFAQFLISSSGQLRDARGSGPSVAEPDHEAWDSGAQVHVTNDGGARVIKLDIPMASAAKALGETAIPDEWRILVRRVRRGEVTTFPAIQTSMPRCPARYRRIALKGGGVPAATPATTTLPHKVWDQPDRLMVEKALRARMTKAAAAERVEWDKVRTLADWEKFRDQRLSALRKSLGAFPARTPLRTQVTARMDFGEGYVVENLVFESRPDLLVTANLYLPARIVGRIPALMLVQNHQGAKNQIDLQDMGMSWARAGVAVLVMDQLGAGERIQSQPWPRESSYYSRYTLANQLYLAGESLMQWMVWDLMRGVDVLLEKPYIDAKRIAMIGSVAGGGDPAAVTAALDNRIAAVAPFNFGEAGPEEHYLGMPRGYDDETAFPGWGSWESTRNLRRSVADQFFPWFICASVAPRSFLYSFELAWPNGVEKQPPWRRYQKVFSLYGKPDRLDHVDGFGPFPGPGESNIGAYQRKRMHPIWARWLGFPIPAQEWRNPRSVKELAALTPAVAAERSPKPASELIVRPKPKLENLRETLGDIEPSASAAATTIWSRDSAEGIAIETEPGLKIPLVLLKPKSATAVVLALAQGGKERFALDRRAQIEQLLNAGAAVCLVDVRGTGETARDPVVRTPGSMSLAATELMLGNTMVGAQLKDARTVARYLVQRPEFGGRVLLWGDSFAAVNPARLAVDESPNMPAGPDIQQQAEPLGALLALLTAYYEDKVQAVAARGGLVSFASVLEDRFAYSPQDVVVPGILAAADVPDIAKAIAPRPVLLTAQVDGRNRLVSADAGHIEWLVQQVRKPR
jgi:hypothetical protein